MDLPISHKDEKEYTEADRLGILDIQGYIPGIEAGIPGTEVRIQDTVGHGDVLLALRLFFPILEM